MFNLDWKVEMEPITHQSECDEAGYEVSCKTGKYFGQREQHI
jgi:hypothetical protein